MGGTLKEASSVAELAAEGRRDEDPARSTDDPACIRVKGLGSWVCAWSSVLHIRAYQAQPLQTHQSWSI